MSYNPIEFEYELDTAIASVMPESWDGHQRIRNYEMFYGDE